MPLLWERLIGNAERAMESRCNNTRAMCGLGMCTGQEDCALEPCLLFCHLKPFQNHTLKDATEEYEGQATGEVAK